MTFVIVRRLILIVRLLRELLQGHRRKRCEVRCDGFVLIETMMLKVWLRALVGAQGLAEAVECPAQSSCLRRLP